MPIAIYTGDESYLLQRAVRTLRQKLVNPDMASLSYKLLNKPDPQVLLETLAAVTFNLGGHMLYEVNEFPLLAAKAEDDSTTRQLDELKSLLQELPPDKTVLFVNSKINKTVGFTKWLVKVPAVDLQEFKTFAPWETDKIVAVLMQECKRDQLQLTPPAAKLLAENMGVNLQVLMNEVEKLAVFSGKSPITVEHVQRLSNHNDNTFAMLQDWVLGKKRGDVFKTLNELLLRQHPVQLFALIQTYVNNLYQLRFWQQMGLSQAEMAERSKKHPFRIKLDLEMIAPISTERLTSLREKTLQLENKAKTGGLNPHLALEVLLAS